MKKICSIAILVVLISHTYAQESLFDKERSLITSYSGFGGPLLSATQINKEFALTIGGKGGVLINKKFAFGGIGFRMAKDLEFPVSNLSDNTNPQSQMSFGAGGVFFEYICKMDNLVHFSFPVNIMAGEINIYENNTEIEIESSAFFIIEPAINIDLRVHKHFTQSLYLSYRKAIGGSAAGVEDNDISGLNAGLIFKFGYN